MLRVWVRRFAPDGEVVCGWDATRERRRGEQSKAQGIDRDPVRSAQPHFVHARGVRWLWWMLLAKVSWAETLWGWPVLPVLCPSERSQADRGRTHQKLPERARQRMRVRTRWWPHRLRICVGAGSVAVLERRHAGSQPPHAHWIPRLRRDAEWWEPAPARQPGHNGRPRLQGARRPSPPHRLDAPSPPWTKMAVPQWDGGETREVEPDTETCGG